MFGTTQKFMEHFGLKCLDDLPGTDELRRLEAEQARARPPKAAETAPELPPEDPNQLKLAAIEAAVPAEPTPEEAVGGGDDDEEAIEREELAEEDIVGGEDDDEEEYDDDDDEEEDDDDDEDEDEEEEE